MVQHPWESVQNVRPPIGQRQVGKTGGIEVDPGQLVPHQIAFTKGHTPTIRSAGPPPFPDLTRVVGFQLPFENGPKVLGDTWP